MKMGMSVLLAMCMILSGIMLAMPAGSRDVAPAESALTPHAPIRINSDADFDAAHGVNNTATGNGTVWAPWIIEDLDVNGTGNASCIYIGNTTKHFILRGCFLHHANGTGTAAGLKLHNVMNAAVEDNTILGNRRGVVADSADFCRINNNSIHSNADHGLELASSSSNNIIEYNNIHNNSHGISLWGSDGNRIRYNTMANNTYGIAIHGNGNLLANNTMSGGGIIIDSDVLSHWVTQTIEITNTVFSKPVIYWKNATGGTVPPGAGEIIIANCSDVVVEHQTLGGGTVGVELGFSFNITISHNNIRSEPLSIYLQHSDNNTVSDNDVEGGRVDFYHSSNNTLHDNMVVNCSIYVNSDKNNLSNNTISNPSPGGIGIFIMADHNALLSNVVSDCEIGIDIYACSNNTIELNNITNCSTGLHLEQASYNRIVRNALGANARGFDLNTASDSNAIFHNDIVGNLVGARDACSNFWDGGYPGGGNYWSDYVAPDLYRGAGQNVWGRDGIGDSPYPIPLGLNIDRYPLMQQYAAFANDEFVPPSALGFAPNGTDIPADALIQITWNETMDWTSVESAFSYTDGMRNYTSANGTWAHDPATNISTFTPTLPFDYETRYNVTVNCTAADIAGNMLDQSGNGTGGEWPDDVLAWNFTTVDGAPYVVSTTPANAQVDVDPNKPLKVVFSERMNVSSVGDSFSFANSSYAWTIDDGVVYWNAEQTEFTFSPVEPLPTNQTFAAMLDGSAARDFGGRAMGQDHTWTFKTWKEPPAPHVVDTYPPPGARNVNVNTYINLAFDSEMDTAAVEAAFSYTDGVSVWTAANGTADWFSENSLVSFQPAERLAFDTTYTVIMNSSATSVYGKSLDGNDNGIPDASDDFVFSFTTSVEPPVVSSHYPGSSQMDVPSTLPAIYLNFSKVMDITSVTNGVSIFPTTPFTPAFSGGGRNLTMVLSSELLEGQEYRVTVLGTVVDLYGVKLDGNSDGWAGDRFTFSFSTKGVEQPVKPEITRVYPPNNATVPLEPFYVEVSFNVPMNRTSVQEAFSFKNATAEVNGTFTWTVRFDAMRFTPSGPLEPNMTYYVGLAGFAKDVNGLTLGNDTAWQYHTEMGEEPPSPMQWVLYGVLIFLVAMVIVLYMANRSVRKELKRTRVKLKRLRREMGLPDEQAPKPAEGPGGDEPGEAGGPAEEAAAGDEK